MKKIIIFTLLTSFLVFGCKSPKKTSSSSTSSSSSVRTKGNFNFVKSSSLSSILDRAEKEKKPVFVDFYTTWCTPCKMMDKDVFTDGALAKYYNDNFISYKVDCEKGNGKNLAMIYKVGNYPTLLFLDHKGEVLLSHTRAAYQTKMKELGQNALSAYKAKFQ